MEMNPSKVPDKLLKLLAVVVFHSDSEINWKNLFKMWSEYILITQKLIFFIHIF